MKVLIDMNLSPGWVRFLREAGFEALHWSTTGEPSATDATIMDWARHAGCIVFTHDLDFSALLAATEAIGPSVILSSVIASGCGAPGFDSFSFGSPTRGSRDAPRNVGGRAESRPRTNELRARS